MYGVSCGGSWAAYQSARLPQAAYSANAPPFASGNDVWPTPPTHLVFFSSVVVVCNLAYLLVGYQLEMAKFVQRVLLLTGAVSIAGKRSGAAGSLRTSTEKKKKEKKQRVGCLLPRKGIHQRMGVLDTYMPL